MFIVFWSTWTSLCASRVSACAEIALPVTLAPIFWCMFKNCFSNVFFVLHAAALISIGYPHSFPWDITLKVLLSFWYDFISKLYMFSLPLRSLGTSTLCILEIEFERCFIIPNPGIIGFAFAFVAILSRYNLLIDIVGRPTVLLFLGLSSSRGAIGPSSSSTCSPNGSSSSSSTAFVWAG